MLFSGVFLLAEGSISSGKAASSVGAFVKCRNLSFAFLRRNCLGLSTTSLRLFVDEYSLLYCQHFKSQMIEPFTSSFEAEGNQAQE